MLFLALPYQNFQINLPFLLLILLSMYVYEEICKKNEHLSSSLL